ncbi:lantibiotic dehydratase C-terminal domain-containing protein [Micromonospora sp. WMMA1363]
MYEQAVRLADPHDHTSLAALPDGAQILTAWQHRRDALAAYRDKLHTASTTTIAVLLPDLLHLHHTRMAGPHPDSERVCLHLARAAALSWSTRSRSHQ